MQYPIIDLIASAYINNGWTGLDISTGKNLIDVPNIEGITSLELNSLYNPIFTNGEPNTQYTFSCDFINADDMNEKHWGLRIFYTDNTVYSWILSNGTIIPSITTEQNKTVSSIEFAFATTILNMTIENFMLEKGATATPFEPYNPNPSNDFPHRLKLPLPHYFPHPVIDALQRAAAGTQTADDTEILRHYLTPLGIGGI